MSTRFIPSTSAKRVAAIGDIRRLPELIRPAFQPDDDFDPIPTPKHGDWLAEHDEIGQSFDDYIASDPIVPDPRRQVIYLQPVGRFIDPPAMFLDRLNAYAGAFFKMAVRVLPAIGDRTVHLTTRIHPYMGNRQLLTRDIFEILLDILPADAFCILAITMDDLYPHPSWNFVFGQASPGDRVGVFSFARYNPVFYGESRSRDADEIMLRRSLRVLAHETCHMFSLAHCIYFRCVMNGSNHLGESDSRPLHLCPVCLRKLQYAVGFDLELRYRGLLAFYKKIGLMDEADWTEGRLKRIIGDR